MRRIEPAFPDLLPVSHRLGPLPAAADGGGAVLDPVEMRLVWQPPVRPRPETDRSIPRRPVRVLVHAESVTRDSGFLERLIAGGCGILVVLDAPLPVERLPEPSFDGQVVLLAPWVPPFWGGTPVQPLGAFTARGLAAGVLLGLGPAPEPFDEVGRAVVEGRDAGAGFVVAGPLAIPPEDRHRVYDGRAGEGGDEALEDMLFHTDLAQLAVDLEREVSRTCRRLGLDEGLPGPATSQTQRRTFGASARLLLWARRLDLLDGVSSPGWQLRRAARALLASRRDPDALLADDNLRVIPGFTPWVEAFARSAWSGGGAPFDDVLARWVAV
ncbi:MAG TPA: hypothetical protein VMT19_01640 [Thermoanaerobaculaceae bacterium]|nr:hypothetical protein [Thermoanaerobaculaceae bacterium]